MAERETQIRVVLYYYNLVDLDGALLKRPEANSEFIRRFPRFERDLLIKIVGYIRDSERENSNNKTIRFRYYLYENRYLKQLEPALGIGPVN